MVHLPVFPRKSEIPCKKVLPPVTCASYGQIQTQNILDFFQKGLVHFFSLEVEKVLDWQL